MSISSYLKTIMIQKIQQEIKLQQSKFIYLDLFFLPKDFQNSLSWEQYFTINELKYLIS